MIGNIPRSARNAKIKPIQQGAYVLAHSRSIIYDILTKIDPTLESSERVFWYTDTDSVLILSTYLPLLSDDIHPDALGKLSNDLKGNAKVVKAFFNSPKLYILIYIVDVGCRIRECIFIGGVVGDACPECQAPIVACALKITMKSKGIRNYCMKEEYYEQLDQGLTVSNLSFLGLKKHHLNLTTKDVKAGRTVFTLSNNTITRTLGKNPWAGRYKVPNSTLTLPWGHEDIPYGSARPALPPRPVHFELTPTDTRRHSIYLLMFEDEGYIGYTTDISRREQQHQGILPGGAQYTKEWGSSAKMLLSISDFLCERDALWFEHTWKGKEDQPKASRHGGLWTEKIEDLKILLNNSFLGEKLKDGIVCIDWHYDPKIMGLSCNAFTSLFPLIHTGEASTTGRQKRKQTYILPTPKRFKLAKLSQTEEDEMFECEDENDDDVSVYDSDNDADAETFRPLDENYSHTHIHSDEDENEMDDFIEDDDEVPASDEDWVEVHDDYFDEMYETTV